jgi:hypothetical protein
VTVTVNGSMWVRSCSEDWRNGISTMGILGTAPIVTLASISPAGDGVDLTTLRADSSMIGMLGVEGEDLCDAPREVTVRVSSEGEILCDVLAPSSHSATVLSVIGSGAESSRTGASGASSPKVEELKLAMEVSGIAGLSC